MRYYLYGLCACEFLVGVDFWFVAGNMPLACIFISDFYQEYEVMKNVKNDYRVQSNQ